MFFFKKKRKKKEREINIDPEDLPPLPYSTRVFPSTPAVRLSLCSVCPCLYRASLPMMTPMTKKSTQSARTRVLRPSSLMGELTKAEECGAATEVTFLFRSPSSSCQKKKGQESKQLSIARDFSGKTDSAVITHRGPLSRLCSFTNRQNEAPWQVKLMFT